MARRPDRPEVANAARRGIIGVARGVRTRQVLEAIPCGERVSFEEVFARVGLPNGLKASGIHAILQRLVENNLVILETDRDLEGRFKGTGYWVTEKGSARLQFYRDRDACRKASL